MSNKTVYSGIALLCVVFSQIGCSIPKTEALTNAVTEGAEQISQAIASAIKLPYD